MGAFSKVLETSFPKPVKNCPSKIGGIPETEFV
jgi:hypothetical protein